MPADILLLYSEDRDFHVYADTKNLDGEVGPILTVDKQQTVFMHISTGVQSGELQATRLKPQFLKYYV